MFAVIKTGGKQYLVKPGDKIKVEKLDVPIARQSRIHDGKAIGTKEEGEVIFSEVLLLEKSKKLEIGNPVVKGAKVGAKVLGHGKGKKLIIFKYKPKKRYKRKIGHRQLYTEVEIKEIIN